MKTNECICDLLFDPTGLVLVEKKAEEGRRRSRAGWGGILLAGWLVLGTTQAANTYYIATNGNHNFPFQSWDDAATNLHAVTNLWQDGDLVLVSNGVHLIESEIAITNGIILRSVNGPDASILRRTGTARFRILSLTHAGGVIEGLTLQNGYPPNSAYGGNVWMSGGLLTNCIIRNGTTYEARGGGVYMSGGNVTHSVITNNYSNAGQSGRYASGGGGIYMDGGLLQNSLIVNNTSTGRRGGGVRVASGMIRNCLVRGNVVTGIASWDSHGGGVALDAAGVMVNCTVVENISNIEAGGVYALGAVTNSIIWNNRCYNPPGANDISPAAAVAFSCSSDLTHGSNGNMISDPLFINAGAGNFRLSLASPARNHGTNVSTIGVVDLDNGDRVFAGDGEGVVDMGAYEIGGTGIGALQCDIHAYPTVGRAPFETTLTAVALGTNTNDLYYRWDFGDNGTIDVEGSDQRVIVTNLTAGSYTLRLTVSNANDEVAEQLRAQYIHSVPETVYVAVAAASVPPYADWGNAATNLADALNMQIEGGTVLIGDGVFPLFDEWEINRALTIRSLNGASNTVIRRQGSASFRLFSMTHPDAVLDGLAIENGYRPVHNLGGNLWMSAGQVTNCIIRNGGVNEGGGAGFYMNGGLVTHSVISNNVQTAGQSGRYSIGGGGVLIEGGILQNSLIAYNTNNGGGDTAWLGGGGVRSRGGLVRNCLIRNNTTTESRGYGGGVGVSGSGVILNCTIVNNHAVASAGGISSIKQTGGYVTNCIVVNNTCDGAGAPKDIDAPASVAFSCSPDLTNGVNGNITVDPLLADYGAGDFRLTLASPARNAGTNLSNAGAIDLDDKPRIFVGDGVSIIDMGAYEYGAESGLECDFLGNPVVGHDPLETVLTAEVLGANTNGLYYWWDFGDTGVTELEGYDKRVVTNSFSAGYYSIRLTVSNAVGDVADRLRENYVLAVPETVYVAANGTSIAPYANWTEAATNLADALAIQIDGGTVLLSNGVFNMSAEWVLDRGVTVRGLGEPEATIIRRAGSAEFRLFSLTHADAVLEGLTIENGYRPSGNFGGNVWMNAGLVTNCIIRGGGVYRGGGAGIYMNGGMVTHSLVTNNIQTADQSGRYSIGGGGVLIDGGTLQNSLIAYNTNNGAEGSGSAGVVSPLAGGGVRSRGGLVRNCLIRNNTTTDIRGYGAGVGVSGSGVILNCTIVGNTADISAGGVSSINGPGGTITNCIVYSNTSIASDSPQDIDEPGIAAYSCSPDLTDGLTGNITDGPLFVDAAGGDFQLQRDSPCIDAGTNQTWMIGAVDLAGLPRILKGTVDMGCYETQPPLGTLFMVR